MGNLDDPVEIPPDVAIKMNKGLHYCPECLTEKDVGDFRGL